MRGSMVWLVLGIVLARQHGLAGDFFVSGTEKRQTLLLGAGLRPMADVAPDIAAGNSMGKPLLLAPVNTFDLSR